MDRKTALLCIKADIGAGNPGAVTPEQIEEEIFKNATSVYEYNLLLGNFSAKATVIFGYFSDETFITKILDGGIPLCDMVKYLTEPLPNGPQMIICRRLVSLLERNPAFVDMSRQKILEIALAIEKSCYNATIEICQHMTNPPFRSWDSSPFVNVYSGRCGAIIQLLDHESTPCQTYGNRLAENIASGKIPAESVGKMKITELCPEATAKEREDIEKRSAQKIQVKVTELFKCPHCHVRKCTYKEIQRRSLDEAPDYVCTCMNCGRTFNGGN